MSFNNPDTIKKLIDGFYGETIKEFYSEHKSDIELIDDFKIFQCPICKNLEVGNHIIVKFKENELRINHLCSKCHNESLEIKEDEELQCPKCSKNLKRGDMVGNWD